MKNRTRGFFVAGTGTDVGKTFVSRLLIEALSKSLPVSYMKPVQTGCKVGKGSTLIAPDFEYVRKSGCVILDKGTIHVPYRFVPACSPYLATRLTHSQISMRKIKQSYDMIKKFPGMRAGCVIVEGAGGVMVPLGPSISMIHLMVQLRLPVILVTIPDLGTLNHTFLTLCAIEAAGVSCAGLIINNRHNVPKDFIYRDNVKTLRASARNIPVLELPYKSRRSKKIMEFCDELLR
jgi:dethiobiotin synthetase